MNTIIIELKKVTQEDLHLFQNALNHYATTLQFLTETLRDRKYPMELSICVEIWFDFNRKTSVQTPPKSPVVKLSLHKAYVLLDALQDYLRDLDNGFQKSRCNRYYMAIDEQLPTYTQLAISK